MAHKSNYLRHLDFELSAAREESRRLGRISEESEIDFERLLPPNECNLTISNESMGSSEVVRRREAFRAAHIKHCGALSIQSEIEDELLNFPENYH